MTVSTGGRKGRLLPARSPSGEMSEPVIPVAGLGRE